MPKKDIHIYLNSTGVPLAIKGSSEILENISNHPFLKKYIPNLTLGENGKANFELQINEEKEFTFETDKKTVAKVNGVLNKDFSITDLITIIEYCFELIRQSSGIYCMHASSSYYNGKAVILMGGASGIGKSKANYLLTKNHKFTFISDEKTLIDSDLNIVGGIDKFVINKEILLKNEGIESSRAERLKNNIPIEHIFQPVTTKNGELFVDEWDANKANFHIYEEISRKIRGTSRRINNFTLPLDSIDTSEIAQKRSILSKAISEKIPCATIYGSPEEVAKFISDKFASS
jgi:hypothetical protein